MFGVFYRAVLQGLLRGILGVQTMAHMGNSQNCSLFAGEYMGVYQLRNTSIQVSFLGCVCVEAWDAVLSYPLKPLPGGIPTKAHLLQATKNEGRDCRNLALKCET